MAGREFRVCAAATGPENGLPGTFLDAVRCSTNFAAPGRPFAFNGQLPDPSSQGPAACSFDHGPGFPPPARTISALAALVLGAATGAGAGGGPHHYYQPFYSGRSDETAGRTGV